MLTNYTDDEQPPPPPPLSLPTDSPPSCITGNSGRRVTSTSLADNNSAAHTDGHQQATTSNVDEYGGPIGGQPETHDGNSSSYVAWSHGDRNASGESGRRIDSAEDRASHQDVDSGLRYGQTLIFSGKSDPQRQQGQLHHQQRGIGGRATSGGGQQQQQQHQQHQPNGNASVAMLSNSRRNNNASRTNNGRNQQTQSQSVGGRQRGGGGGSGADSSHQHNSNSSNNNNAHAYQQYQSNDYSLTSHSSGGSASAATTNTTTAGRSIGASARLEQAANSMHLPEDMRISKLLRRLAAEKNLKTAAELCDKLQLTISDPINGTYIRRSFDLLANTIIGHLRDAPSELRLPLAHIFGHMGFVVVRSGAFSVYRQWLHKCSNSSNSGDMRTISMQALLKTLQLDAAGGKAELRDQAGVVMAMLKESLEAAEQVPLFTVATDTLVVFSAAYPNVFEPHFTDVVDIVVGWHLETDQPVALKRHCAAVLQGFGRFWSMDGPFMVNLLGQFLEDIAQCGDEILAKRARAVSAQPDDSHDKPRQQSSPLLDGSTPPELSFAALVGAFTSVLKCTPNTLPNSIGWSMLSDSFARIATVAGAAIAQCDSAELLININEFLIIVLDFHPLDVVIPFDYVHQQFGNVGTSGEPETLSTLLLTLKIVTEVKVEHIGGFIERLFAGASPMHRMRYARSMQLRKAALQIYTQVLNIKSVPVLQSVYRSILSDLGLALRTLGLHPTDEHPWPVDLEAAGAERPALNIAQAEVTICFLLTALSTLATSTSSIIAMWALQPSILELLVHHLQPDRFAFWCQHAATHAAVVRLLDAHCQKNSNFMASSSVLNVKSSRITESFSKLSFDTTATTSPTTQHYTIILKLIGRCFRDASDGQSPGEPIMLALLDWATELFVQSKPYARTLTAVTAFTELVRRLVQYTTTTQSALVLARATRCLEALLPFDQLHPDISRSLAEVCCVHMCSTHGQTRSLYAVLFAALPLRVTLPQVCAAPTGIARDRAERALRMQRWLQTSGVATASSVSGNAAATAAMRPVYFRRLMETLALNRERTVPVGRTAFEACWEISGSSSTLEGDALQYAATALSDTRCLHAWAQWAAAQHCVDTKLRTALGKPQDTFLRIESMLKEVARILATPTTPATSTNTTAANNTSTDSTNSGTASMMRNLRTVCGNQQNIRVLLGFVEALEKSVHNAGDGTAFALPLPDKPVRLFFHVNAPTCREWFNRCRTAIALVALHSMEPEMVIRYADTVLRQLAAQSKTAEPLFEHTLMSLTWALLRTGEPDTLHGLHLWALAVSGRKFAWIRAAAEQAAGRREAALVAYTAILEADGRQQQQRKLDSHVRDFVADQIATCLDVQQRWQDLLAFQSREQSVGPERATLPLACKSNEQIVATATFLDTSTPHTGITHDLGSWQLLDGFGGGAGASRTRSNALGGELLSQPRMQALIENTLTECIVHTEMAPLAAVDKLRKCRMVLIGGLQECMRTGGTRDNLAQLTVLAHVCHKVLAMQTAASEAGVGTTTTKTSIDSLYIERHLAPSGATLMRVLGWSELLQRRMQINQTLDSAQSTTIQRMHLDASSMARKTGNLRLCERMLQTFFAAVHGHGGGGGGDSDGGVLPATLAKICEQCVQPTGLRQGFNAALLTADTMRGLYETAKWMRETPERRADAVQFGATAVMAMCVRVSGQTGGGEERTLCDRSARGLLRVADWIQGEPDKLLTADPDTPLARLVSFLPDLTASGERTTHAADIPAIDTAIGKLIHNSVRQSPELAKAWGALGNWCYRWGRRIVEQRVQDGGTVLGAGDMEALRQALPAAASDADADLVAAILNRHQISGDDVELAVSDSTEAIEMELRSAVQLLATAEPETLRAVLQVWRAAQQNVYSFYGRAAEAYFKYLQLTAGDGADTESDADTDTENNTPSTACARITATLRLLRLIVKHALGLQTVLEAGLASTPTAPWMAIIPQLFARLNHHEPYVRRRVSELLCRLGVAAPHLVIFPAVVGSHLERHGRDLADFALHDDNVNNTGDAKTLRDGQPPVAGSSNALLDTLAKQAPETVQQVQCLVRELKRVTLLWDELWLVGLAQVYAETARRLAHLEAELRHSDADTTTTSKEATNEESVVSLLAERYRLLLRPVIFTVERLHAITSARPTTANERAFQRCYAQHIDESLAALRAPFRRDAPSEAWQRFKQFYAQLHQRSHSRYVQPLQMADISPVLAQLRDTAIQMPGVQRGGGGEVCCIRSVNNSVRILPSKTKPKKLAFHGSDGRRYTYLFKGMEDLRLDERIMQFLAVANTMMAKSGNEGGARTRYRARHYSVIPLGSRSGLIAWVDGVVPFYALYKKWLLREASHPKREKAAASGAAAVAADAAPMMRPSDLYAARLAPHLAKYGCKLTDSREQWPLEACRETLAELIAETPRDLLSKELWCTSPNASQWRQSVRNFGHSVAVMSVIGYVIGLGDRHLDNILVELGTGEVVHIDYNLCFEKGKSLRAPERVPFRMTQNVEDALGVTGVEGTFRLACEHVLKTLKKGRETLLTLLEAFVYDPLVDWDVGEEKGAGGAAGVGGGGVVTAGALAVSVYGGEALGTELRQARQVLEHEVNRDTMALRFAEIRTEWLKNGEHVFAELTSIGDLVQHLQWTRLEIRADEERRDLMSKQLAIVGEVQQLGSAMHSHPLNTASQRYALLKRTRTEHEHIRQQLEHHESANRQQLESYAANARPYAFTTSAVSTLGPALDPPYEFACVRELLENSAQGGALYAQCEQLLHELDASYKQQATVNQQCLHLHELYVQSIEMLPIEPLLAAHRWHRYAEWYAYLVAQPTVTACRDVIAQLQCVFSDAVPAPVVVQHLGHLTVQLHAAWCEATAHAQFLTERLQAAEDAWRAAPPVDAAELNAPDCVRMQMLCGFNRRMLMVESAATAAGFHLADARTGGNLGDNDACVAGDWLIDELALWTTMAERTVDYSLGAPDENERTIVDCLHASAELYTQLQNLHHVLIGNLLSKTMTGIFTENVGLLAAIAKTSGLQAGIAPIDELLAALHDHLQRIRLGEAPADTYDRVALQGLRDQLEELCGHLFGSSMVWLGFLNVLAAQRLLGECVSKLQVPHEWRGYDQLGKAKEFPTPSTLAATLEIQTDISTVQWLHTLIEMFALCLQQAYAIKGAAATTPPHNVPPLSPLGVQLVNTLTAPIRQFCAAHIQQHLLGVPTFALGLLVCRRLVQSDICTATADMADQTALDDLCRTATETALASGLLSTAQLTHTRQLHAQIEANGWMRARVPGLRRALNAQRPIVAYTQRLLASHLWLHDDRLAAATTTPLPGWPLLQRAAILEQLRNVAQTGDAWRTTIERIRAELATFKADITQRLRWAVGANPQLAGVEQMFMMRSTVLAERCNAADWRALELRQACLQLVSFEQLRAGARTAEAAASDQLFFDLVAQWERNCTMSTTCAAGLSAVEVALVELLDPEGAIDTDWLRSVAGIVDEMIDRVRDTMVETEWRIARTVDQLHDRAQRLRMRMAVHHRLSTEVRALVRAQLRATEAAAAAMVDGQQQQQQQHQQEVLRMREYLRAQRAFVDGVADVHAHVLSRDLTEEVVSNVCRQVAAALAALDGIYDGLYALEGSVSASDTAVASGGQIETLKEVVQPVRSISPANKATKELPAEQKRNAYAVSVWRRIRMKLEGRDPDPNRRSTVAEQMDWMIREARNVDNLAVLYEGWAPWV